MSRSGTTGSCLVISAELTQAVAPSRVSGCEGSRLDAYLHAISEALVLQLAQHDGGEGVAVAGEQVVAHAPAAVDVHQRRLGEVRPHLRWAAGKSY